LTASKTMKIESIKLKNFEIMSPENILKTLEENRDTILSFGVRQIGVFGSYVRREQTESSDLDLLVDFNGLKE
jgi:predicted nucleotidyltransferase